MSLLRNLPGVVLALILAVVGVLLMLVAWAGWTLAFGWPAALVTLVLSAIAGFNGYALVGAFFFARDYMHWPLEQCFALSAVGLVFATPGMVRLIARILIGDRDDPA